MQPEEKRDYQAMSRGEIILMCQRLEDADRAHRELFDARLEALETAVKVARDMAEQRMQISAAEVERRLEALNNLRADYDRQRGQFLLITSYQAAHKALEDKIDSQIKPIEKALAVAEGKASQGSVNVALLLAAVGLLTSMARIIVDLVK